MFSRTKVFTYDEFMKYRYGDETRNKLSDALKKLSVVTMAVVLYLEPTMANATISIEKIDSGGKLAVHWMQFIGFWLVNITVLIDVLKLIIKRSDKGKITSTIIHYILLYASLYIIPEIFAMLKEMLEAL